MKTTRMVISVAGGRLIQDYDPAELRTRYCPNRRTPISYVRIALCERGCTSLPLSDIEANVIS